MQYNSNSSVSYSVNKLSTYETSTNVFNLHLGKQSKDEDTIKQLLLIITNNC